MKLLYLAIAIALTGCAAAPLKTVSTFNIGEAEAMLRAGNNTVKGSALIRQAGGGTVTCAGQTVDLIPVTLYATERMLNIYGNDIRGHRPALGYPQHETTNQDYLRLSKSTVCDAQGFFKFTEVTRGSFYVVTSVIWRTNPYFLDGGALMQRVDLTGGETKEIVLAP